MSPTSRALEEADRLMVSFAERTGLVSHRSPRRYLWTDAFAVCNFLGLARATGNERYTHFALRLVDQVHHVLGSYRDDDSRSGWISGLDEEEGEAHPTRGGLRIGKELPERGAAEPFDEHLEWRRDGQYFHYLTKWMHALDKISRWTGQAKHNAWARELAKAAHDAFVYTDRSGQRMVWKMSTDLSRPLVSSMGHHDPLDGFITCAQLRTASSMRVSTSNGPSLEKESADFASMIVGQDFATSDPLGLGGLLADASRVAQLAHLGTFFGADLLESLLAAALRGLAGYVRQGDLGRPASRRLAFRELGLAIGLRAVELPETAELWGSSRSGAVREQIRALTRYFELGSEIRSFWLDPAHRQSHLWSEHRDINDVMLATSLVPAGLLLLFPGDSR